jgi:ubiquinone/menaquinone biosynthesis C-methylase UbiE
MRPGYHRPRQPLRKSTPSDYQEKLSVESRKWSDHLALEATGQMLGWLDHPTINAHYQERGLIDGLPWWAWISRHFGGPATRSMDLGCGSGSLSMRLLATGATQCVEGVDASPERIAEAEKRREAAGAPGRFIVADCNEVALEENRYDLIVSSHSFHHFLELEAVMDRVLRALTPRGLFILEEFVGPTQFQWTDAQIDATRTLTSLVPERFRILPWGAVKPFEGRPEAADVAAASPFESIRSAEIGPLFERRFEIVHRRLFGGTVQHLFYNGIIHNFVPGNPEAEALVRGVYRVEDALIDSGFLPSDFQLLVGRRPAAA